MKFYYENVLSNQNVTAKPNLIWVADITEIELNRNKKLYIFLCIDAYTNTVIAHTVSQKTVSSRSIIKCLNKAIEKRFLAKPLKKVIIHTDRGTQFSSQAYRNFTKHFSDFMIPSMSRENTPTDNAMAERFMRTFKNHVIDGRIVEQALHENILAGSKTPRSVINIYIKSVNLRPNRKSLLKPPERHDNESRAASMLMNEPKYPRAFSDKFGPDSRREHIYEFKRQSQEVIKVLEEIAAESEVVKDTPFDKDTNSEIKLLEKRLIEICNLIQNNPMVIKTYVEAAVEPISENILDLQEEFREEMETLNRKIDILLPKVKKDRQTQPLRDPIDDTLFPVFLANAGDSFQQRKSLKRAQLRVTYTILYYSGLRINEIRHLTQEDIERAIAASQFSLIHHKTKQAHRHVLSEKAIQDLRELNTEFYIIFEKYQFKYLFGKHKPLHEKRLIQMVNTDLKQTSEKYSIPFNVKSHSFRVNMITNLLKVTSVQNTADIMGHNDIRSTMSYNRYALSKSDILELLNKINNNK